ncbi:hypothetical protein K435DRAFT_125412 [Dendrothele bispora CBS 962.96]|uniref:Nephrocystin 3-like N-terminal domain-containing protein n=1 Tax=Dendrothele bispora (strain CBS 962.96) TaxID=1314807 RepID=A0A4S8KMT0_DENBC|nr:hypothetical protein K435DRAFT_125412 [Dendrothele bispora CBS 962.96]
MSDSHGNIETCDDPMKSPDSPSTKSRDSEDPIDEYSSKNDQMVKNQDGNNAYEKVNPDIQNVFQKSSDFDSTPSNVTVVGRDPYYNTYNNYYNNYSNYSEESEDAFLKERLNPIGDPVDKCLEGTRQNLLDDICDWAIDPQNTFAWICGTVGTGKSAVAVTLAQRFRYMQNQIWDLDIQLALTFHCAKGQETSNSSLLVPTMCYQLAKVYPKYKTALINMFKKDLSLSGSRLPLTEQIQLFLDASLFQPLPDGKVIIIIDGLDEWGTESDQKVLIEGITHLIGEVQSLVIIITSHTLNIQRVTGLERVKKFDLMASGYNANADIKLIVERSLEGRCSMDDMNKLVAKADGLFIWITVALQYIQESMNEAEAIETIINTGFDEHGDNPYRGLDEMYKVVLEKYFVGNANMRYFKEVIGIILAAVEPISMQVLEQMLNSNGITPIIVEKVLKNLEAVIFNRNGKLCYHLSFEEFLSSQRRSEKWAVEQTNSHLQMTNGCLDIMGKELKFNICNLETLHIRVTNPSIEERVTEYVSMGLQYSCLHWTNHLIKAKECNEKDCVLNFLTSKKVIYWMECLSVMGEIGAITSGVKNIKDWGDVNKIPSISKVAEDIQRFVDSFSAVIMENTPEGHKDQATSVAYSPDERHMTSGPLDHTVRLWGAQTGEQVGQPLQGQNEGNPKLLVDAGADVNAQGGFYANALQAAVYGENEEIVKLLVDAGADVNVQGGKYGNALQAAAAGTGSEAIVKILLEAGADVNAQGGQYGNALQAAASAGNETIMQLLLEAGADIKPEPRSHIIDLFPLDGQDGSETMLPEPPFYSIEVLPLDDLTDEADTEPPEAFSVELTSLERNGDGDF